MTRAQIVAELRRSAREDAKPFRDCSPRAWLEAVNKRTLEDRGYPHKDMDWIMQCRTFFLIVACALEDES